MQRIIYWLVILAAELFALKIDGAIFRSHLAAGGFSLPSDLNCFRVNGALAQHLWGVTPAIAANACAFMYPPPFLMVIAPLAWLNPLWSYVLWSGAGIALLALAGRAVKLSWPAICLGLAVPANLYCLAIGQTGAIISAFLVLSLGLAGTNPVLAGIIAGGLIVKPQFAVLLPVCYLASRNWRALSAAAASTLTICLLTTLCFGPGVWLHFLTVETGTARNVLNLPWPQPFQGIMISMFMSARSLGAGLRLAYAAQALTTLAAAGAAWFLWSRDRAIAPNLRLLLTLCLVPLATPYAYIYDIPGVAILLAGFTAQKQWRNLLPLTALFLFTSLYIVIAMVSFLTGGLLLAMLVIYVWQNIEPIRRPTPPADIAPVSAQNA
jgi:hypothetical protein